MSKKVNSVDGDIKNDIKTLKKKLKKLKKELIPAQEAYETSEDYYFSKCAQIDQIEKEIDNLKKILK